MSIPIHRFIDPVDRSRSISTVDKESPTGEYGRNRRSMPIHLRRITFDCRWSIKNRDNFVVDFINDTCANLPRFPNVSSSVTRGGRQTEKSKKTRPGPDGRDALRWYRRLRVQKLTLSVLNCAHATGQSFHDLHFLDQIALSTWQSWITAPTCTIHASSFGYRILPDIRRYSGNPIFR